MSTPSEQVETIVAKLSGQDLSEFLADVPTSRAIRDWLERAPISADAKSLLFSVAATAVKIGGMVVNVGLKVLQTIQILVREHPSTAFGLVVGLVLSYLTTQVPLIGALLSPLLSPIFLAFGIGMGAIIDMKDRAVRSRVEELSAEFAVLRA